jgi:hypothetical protein
MQNIEIDWDIHKMIEAERQGFDEAPYLALRRLLKLPDIKPDTTGKFEAGAGIPWTEDGVSVPHGSLARMEYLRGIQVYEGRFINGRLVVNGQAFDTLSAAASALAVTKDGAKTRLNGWNYWLAQFPGEKKWRSLGGMRRAKQKP